MIVNVSLTDDLNDFLNDRVASGQYASASEVVQDALRLLVQQDEVTRNIGRNSEWLRKAYQEGLESGDAGEIDFEAIKAEGRALLKARR